ncbi:MAG: alpha/beta fold hydrolase [Mangrovicoccus sp.]
MLNYVEYGDATGVPLLVVHGLYGSARNWNVIAKRLADERPVIAVDMRNHGSSPWFDSQSYPDMAADLAEVIEAHGGKADLVGHSMGGKASMTLALTRPELLRKLIIADIAPVTYTHTQIGYIHAMKALDLAPIKTRSDADQALRDSVPELAVRAFLLQSLDVQEKRWRLNLDVLGAEMDKIIGFPQLDGQFPEPTLFLSGGASDYVLPEHRPQITALFPKARFVKIPGAGHWLHAEKPREFEAAIRAYLAA